MSYSDSLCLLIVFRTLKFTVIIASISMFVTIFYLLPLFFVPIFALLSLSAFIIVLTEHFT